MWSQSISDTCEWTLNIGTAAPYVTNTIVITSPTCDVLGVVMDEKYSPTIMYSIINKENETMGTCNVVKRWVALVVVDPHIDVDDEHSEIYFKDYRVTSKTDEELKFEINLPELLKEHNKYRVTVRDEESSKGRDVDVMLRPARISDLKMFVREIGRYS